MWPTGAYGREADVTGLRIDRADVRQTAEELTLILGAAGLHVMLIRLRYDGWVDEVINGAGSVVNGAGRLDPRGRELSLELDALGAGILGF